MEKGGFWGVEVFTRGSRSVFIKGTLREKAWRSFGGGHGGKRGEGGERPWCGAGAQKVGRGATGAPGHRRTKH